MSFLTAVQSQAWREAVAARAGGGVQVASIRVPHRRRQHRHVPGACRQPRQTEPGAVAVPGPDADRIAAEADDTFTLTPTDTSQQEPSNQLLSAVLVDPQQERHRIQEQVEHEVRDRLEWERAERERMVAIAEPVRACWCSPRVRRLGIIGVFLLIIAIVLATVLGPPPPPPVPLEPATPNLVPFDKNGTWTQLGQVLNGDFAEDYFGTSVTLSWDGTILAAGAPRTGWSGGGNGGFIRVFQQDEQAWASLGQDVVGRDAFGWSTSLSEDGRVLAVGAIHGKGHVQVLEFKDDSGWKQVGEMINGTADGVYFGDTVSLSADGNVLAAGSIQITTGTPYVGVFERTPSGWTQTDGPDIGVVARVALSGDGTILAAVGPFDEQVVGDTFGQVRVFQFS